MNVLRDFLFFRNVPYLQPVTYIVDLLTVVVQSTQGVPQADGGEPTDTDMAQRMRDLRLGDSADSMPSLPNMHEKADMVLAYSTVTGSLRTHV